MIFKSDDYRYRGSIIDSPNSKIITPLKFDQDFSRTQNEGFLSLRKRSQSENKWSINDNGNSLSSGNW